MKVIDLRFDSSEMFLDWYLFVLNGPKISAFAKQANILWTDNRPISANICKL